MASPLRMALTRIIIAMRRARDWLIAKTIFGVLRVISLFPADKAIALVDYLARRIGPLTSRHRLAMANLSRAYPEKPKPNGMRSPSKCGATCPGLPRNMSFSTSFSITIRQPPKLDE